MKNIMKNYIEIENEIRNISKEFEYKICYCSSGNFVTPYIVTVLKINKLKVELSYGQSLTGNRWLYGITVLNLAGKGHEFSKCCYSIKELKEHLKELKSYKE